MRYLFVVMVCLGCVFGCREQKAGQEATEQTAVKAETKESNNRQSFRISPVAEDAERELGVVDLGKMTSGEVVVGDLLFENGFDKPIVLLGVNASCGCLSFEYDSSPLKVGEKRKIKYRYDSKTKSGKQYSTVSIKTSEGGYGLKAECDVK